MALLSLFKVARVQRQQPLSTQKSSIAAPCRFQAAKDSLTPTLLGAVWRLTEHFNISL